MNLTKEQIERIVDDAKLIAKEAELAAKVRSLHRHIYVHKFLELSQFEKKSNQTNYTFNNLLIPLFYCVDKH